MLYAKLVNNKIVMAPSDISTEEAKNLGYIRLFLSVPPEGSYEPYYEIENNCIFQKYEPYYEIENNCIFQKYEPYYEIENNCIFQKYVRVASSEDVEIQIKIELLEKQYGMLRWQREAILAEGSSYSDYTKAKAQEIEDLAEQIRDISEIV